MDDKSLTHWEHDHEFGQSRKRPGEVRTFWVIGITAIVMVIEIVAGWRYGSMALLADGLHMGSHASALLISAFAYVYARRNAHDPRFCFGTGKVNALGGFAGALLLIGFALLMGWHSVERIFNPVAIAFDQATIVAVVGLLVNAVCAWILGTAGHDHDHGHHHDGSHEQAHHHDHGHHHDHNLRSAYLHVIADALTSVLAIVALICGKFFGWWWMDPLMGIVGAGLVAKWSIGLLRDTSRVLLDYQAPHDIHERITKAIEAEGESKVTDLHIWSIGPGIYAAEGQIVARGGRSPDDYRAVFTRERGIVHTTIQVQHRSQVG